MTFNEGMQIDTSTTSSSGGGGRGPMLIGGGVGGLIIVVIALLLGVDPGGLLSSEPQAGQQQQSSPGFDLSQCKTGADANKIVQCRLVATGNSVDGVWSQLLKGYKRPRVQLFTGQVDTGCGPATSDVGPFYCPVDQTAYFDTDFFQVLVDQFGSSGGPLAQEYVVRSRVRPPRAEPAR
jgi:predicted metalloprotease